MLYTPLAPLITICGTVYFWATSIVVSLDGKRLQELYADTKASIPTSSSMSKTPKSPMGESGTSSSIGCYSQAHACSFSCFSVSFGSPFLPSAVPQTDMVKFRCTSQLLLHPIRPRRRCEDPRTPLTIKVV